MKQGILVVLSGFSGAGKGTLIRELLARYPEEYCLSVSATTRAPREGEQDGREYFFKTDKEFEQMIERGELLEHAGYVNHYYGTPASYVMERLNEQKNVILEIELQGAMMVKEKFPQALMLFVTPPDAKELKRRLIDRGTETEEVIRSRLSRAVEEAEGCEAYDYLIINDEIDRAVEEIHRIIRMQREKMDYHLDLIQEIREDLKKFSAQ